MNVSAGIVGLPDFHRSVPNRLSAHAKNASAEIRNLADGRCDVVVDDEKIIVGVEWKCRRIVRTFCLFGCCSQRFSEKIWCIQKSGCEPNHANLLQKTSSI